MILKNLSNQYVPFMFQNDPNAKLVCPLRIDMYCNNNTETALHAAIKGRQYDITLSLLKAGANPNSVIKAYHDINEVCKQMYWGKCANIVTFLIVYFFYVYSFLNFYFIV